MTGTVKQGTCIYLNTSPKEPTSNPSMVESLASLGIFCSANIV